MGSLVEGGTYFRIENGDEPILIFFTGNEFALIHFSMMCMCNWIIKLKLVYSNNTSCA